MTIMTAFCGLRRADCDRLSADDEEDEEEEGNEFEKSSSVSLHCRNGTMLGYQDVSERTD